jgi:hypothetical protein
VDVKGLATSRGIFRTPITPLECKNQEGIIETLFVTKRKPPTCCKSAKVGYNRAKCQTLLTSGTN